VRWPLIGRLEPSRVVLLCSGLLVVVSASAVRERQRSPSQTHTESSSPARGSTR
jgi:hypothetical protein